jgi:hypothetical protein
MSKLSASICDSYPGAEDAAIKKADPGSISYAIPNGKITAEARITERGKGAQILVDCHLLTSQKLSDLVWDGYV